MSSIAQSGDKPLRKYYFTMLNSEDDDLGPYEFRLLAHYRRVCGANGGTCTESTDTTAKRTQMGHNRVKVARKFLTDNGYISADGGVKKGDVVEVRCPDRMAENIRRYQQPRPDQVGVGEPRPDQVYKEGTSSSLLDHRDHNDSLHEDRNSRQKSGALAIPHEASSKPQAKEPKPQNEHFVRGKWYLIVSQKCAEYGNGLILDHPYSGSEVTAAEDRLRDYRSGQGYEFMPADELNDRWGRPTWRTTKGEPLKEVIAEYSFGLNAWESYLPDPGGRIGKLIKELAPDLGLDYHEANQDEELASLLRHCYKGWTMRHEHAPRNSLDLMSMLWQYGPTHRLYKKYLSAATQPTEADPGLGDIPF